MVYLKQGESTFVKGNITKVELLQLQPRSSVYKSIPQSMYKGGGGRPRIAPVKGADNSNLKERLGVTIKGMTAEQRRAYNRLAKRKEYAKELQRKQHNQTADDYKKSISKKIKDMSENEKNKYYKLAKQESRLRNK